MSISAAKSRLMQAKMNLESNRVGDAESTIAAAEKFLEGLPDAETAGIRAELAALRAQIEAKPSPQEERDLSAAKAKLRQARSQIADRNTSGIEDTFANAERHVLAVRETHRGAMTAELEAVRAEIAALRPDAPVAPGAVAPAAPVAAPATSDDHQASLSRAKSRVTQAKMMVESGRTENVAAVLEEALGFLAQVPTEATAALRAEIDEVRRGASGREAAETARRLQSEIERKLGGASSDARTMRYESATTYLAGVTTRLADDDVKAALTAAQIAAYHAKIDEIRAEMARAIKTDAIARAEPLIVELEALAAGELFAGLEPHEVYVKTSEIKRIEQRLEGATYRVPPGDPDIAAIEARVRAVDQIVDKASAAWGKARLDAEVGNSWALIEQEITGWDAEQPPTDNQHLHEPELPKTRRAVQRIRFLLEDPATIRIRSEHAGDPAIEVTYAEAQRVHDAAAAKLDAAFHSVLEAGEGLATPMRRMMLDRPGLLLHSAESVFAGSPYRDPLVARARKLDERWKTEVAAIMKARKELFDKLDAEATKLWPGVRDAIGAAQLDPDRLAPGTLIRFDDIYNRCGWDYGSREYDFACRREDILFGGVYAPHVLEALEHAWYELKLDVSDRFEWDVIAEVLKPGKIGVRTEVVLRDKFTNFEIGKLEEWPLHDCIKIRIIALHAGPVVVGPRP